MNYKHETNALAYTFNTLTASRSFAAAPGSCSSETVTVAVTDTPHYRPYRSSTLPRAWSRVALPCSECHPQHPHLHILQSHATHGMMPVKDVYTRRWRTHNTPERRIYTSVAANVLNLAVGRFKCASANIHA